MKLKWELRKLRGGGYRGVITLPTGRGRRGKRALRIQATSKSKSSALLKAAGIAASIAENPIMQSVLPPGSSKAIRAVAKLAAAAKVGKLEKTLLKYTGKGAKRLAKKLKFW